MNYRKATILTQEDASTPATKTMDITVKDPISRLYVKFNYKNNGHVATAHPAKCVSAIEVVDGSDVIASLSGMQAEVLHFLDTKERRGRELEYRNDCWGDIVFPINFGRYLYDPELALDPTKYRNPQLKVTHNLALGGSAPDDATLEVFAEIFDEKVITPIGHLVSKEWYRYTLQGDAYHHVDLPTDHPFRRLVILSLAADKELDDQIAEVRLNEDNDKRVPIHMNMVDLMRIAAEKYGQFFEDIVGTFDAIDTRSWYLTPSNKVNVQCSPIGQNPFYTANERMGGYQDFEPTAVTAFRLLVSGFEPHGAIPLDFGDLMDIEDWYDVTKLGSLRLRLKAGSSPGSNSTCQLVSQQIRRYAT